MEENITIEILKTAILLERRGKAFYLKVASQTKDPDVKQIFEIMAEDQDELLKVLSEQVAYYSQNQAFKIIKLPKASGTTVSEILSTKIKENISAASYEAAAISSAIDMETRAIAVYTERAKQSTIPEEKKFYQWLADWEKGHYDILFELDSELKEKIWFDNGFWPS